MNPLIYAQSPPRTDAEAKAFEKLYNLSAVAALYYDLSNYNDTDVEYDWERIKQDVPRPTQKVLKQTRDVIAKVKRHLETELIELIDDYQASVDVIRKNPRPRSEILDEEGFLGRYFL